MDAPLPALELPEPPQARSMQRMGMRSADKSGATTQDKLGLVGAGGLFSVVYADPPWCYENRCSQGGIHEQYTTMNDEDICGLRVPAAKNAVLYLWATAPRLPVALDVMLAWGFAYKSCAVWDKVRLGIGYWFRGQHELLLCGVRGNMRPPPVELRISSVIRCKSGQHSRKPDYVRDMIAKWFPDVPRLEMFSRVKRPGWEPFGNQIEHDLLSGGGGAEQAGDGNAETRSRAASHTDEAERQEPRQ